MNNQASVPVSVTILDKEYTVACPESERDGLLNSARTLDKRMREMREDGQVLGTERLAVITALNIVHELIHSRNQLDAQYANVNRDVKRLEDKISGALSRRPTADALD